MISSNYSCLIISICLHTVIWFQIFLFKTNNFQTDLFDLLIGPEQVFLVLVRVDLGVMAVKGWLHTHQTSITRPSKQDAV